MKKTDSEHSQAIVHLLSVRLFVIAGLTIGSIALISSSWLGNLLGHSYVGPAGGNASPYVVFVLLLAIFYFTHRENRDAKLALPNARQTLLGLFVFVACLLVSYGATHPSPARFFAMHSFIQSFPVAGGPLVAATLYWSLFLPVVGAFMLWLPQSYIWRYKYDLAFLGVTFVLYLYTAVLDAVYHLVAAPFILGQTAWLLAFFPGTVVADLARLQLTYDDFAVLIGPVCTGLNIMMLYTAGFIFFWWKAQATPHPLVPVRALTVLCGGLAALYILNIVRIALIMIIGASFPGLGVELFHSSAGVVIAGLSCLLVLPLLLPWMTGRNQSKPR